MTQKGAHFPPSPADIKLWIEAKAMSVKEKWQQKLSGWHCENVFSKQTT